MEIQIIYFSQPLGENNRFQIIVPSSLQCVSLYGVVFCYTPETVSATTRYKKYVAFTLHMLRTVFFHRDYFSTALQLLLVSFALGMHGF